MWGQCHSLRDRENLRDELAEIPCFVTERKAWEAEEEPIASMAICKSPDVPFLNPTFTRCGTCCQCMLFFLEVQLLEKTNWGQTFPKLILCESDFR